MQTYKVNETFAAEQTEAHEVTKKIRKRFMNDIQTQKTFAIVTLKMCNMKCCPP